MTESGGGARRGKQGSLRVEICDCANEANSGVFGKMEDDDIISFPQLLIQLPLASFGFDLRRTGHFESEGRGERGGGDEEKSRNRGLETHL